MTDRTERIPSSRRALAWTSATCIAASLLVMIGVSAAGPSIVVPAMARTSGGPPWWGSLDPQTWILFVMWGTAIVAAVGVGTGIAAVARGARPRVKALLAVSFIAVAALTITPPAGSTDAQSYAIDGSMLVLGHSPYVDTPAQMAQAGDRFAVNSPKTWQQELSDYGPLATAEEWASAEFGGWSMAAVTFWLKLWVALAFVAVTILLDRVLRSDPARRFRAHLLWSLNPLLLWEIVAAGHIDGIAVAFGLAGLILLAFPQPQPRPAAWRCLAAGALIGLAGDIKITFLAFGLGAAWALRRSATGLAALTAGAAAVLVPSYIAFGMPAVRVLSQRGSQVTWDNLYQVIYRPIDHVPFGATGAPSFLSTLAIIAFTAVAALTFTRMPDRVPRLPAVTPALALSIGWILLWPYQRPWYDVMIIALLALYPRSWLDWVVLARLCFGAITYMESSVAPLHSTLQRVQLFQGEWITSVVRLLAAAALIWMCTRGRWGFGDEPDLADLGEPVLQPQP